VEDVSTSERRVVRTDETSERIWRWDAVVVRRVARDEASYSPAADDGGKRWNDDDDDGGGWVLPWGGDMMNEWAKL